MATNETSAPPRVELRATRAAIRPYEAEDAPALFALRDRNRDFFAPYEPSSIVIPTTVDAQRDLLHQERAEWDAGRRFSFAVHRDGRLVGQVQLSHVMRGALQSATLGYFIDERENGNGYATEATILALRFAFEHAKLHRVEAGTLPENERSMRVLRKAGFRHEGTAVRLLEIDGAWRDHEVFAITREEWTGGGVT